MKPIDTIIFDFGGVLLNLNKQACVDAFARLGVYGMDEWINNYKQKGLFLLFEEGKITTDDFFVQLQEMAGKHIAIHDLKQAYLAFLEDLPVSKLSLIRRLRGRYKILMLSNINEFIFDHCAKTRFPDPYSIEVCFDKVYLSFETGVCKPDRAIFDYMIVDSYLDPQRCLFLDDG
ncbi:MAG: HAD family phosphatase, partial [Bacteroidales bacterium]|nr:HAD family phosphatase [Bacteroidales bacterium]